MPGFLYALFGSVREASTVGPTAVLALMSFSYAGGGDITRAATLSLFTGLIQIALAVFKMGTLILVSA